MRNIIYLLLLIAITLQVNGTPKKNLRRRNPAEGKGQKAEETDTTPVLREWGVGGNERHFPIKGDYLSKYGDYRRSKHKERNSRNIHPRGHSKHRRYLSDLVQDNNEIQSGQSVLRYGFSHPRLVTFSHPKNFRLYHG